MSSRSVGQVLRRRWWVVLAVAFPLAALGVAAVWEPPSLHRTSVSLLAPDDLVQPAQLTRFTADLAAALRSTALEVTGSAGPEAGEGRLSVERTPQSGEIVVHSESVEAVPGAGQALVARTQAAVSRARAASTARAEQRLDAAREVEDRALEALAAATADLDRLIGERGGVRPSAEVTRLAAVAAELRVCAVSSGPGAAACAADLQRVGRELTAIEAAASEERRLDDAVAQAESDASAAHADRRDAELDVAGVTAPAAAVVVGENALVERWSELARRVGAVLLAAAVLGLLVALVPSLLQQDAGR